MSTNPSLRIPPSTMRQRRLRQEINEKLGGKCSNGESCSSSVNGGFNDPRALHIDHVESGGSKELLRGQGAGMKRYYRVLRDIRNGGKKYKLLCANCNAIKRSTNREALGQRQQKQPFKRK